MRASELINFIQKKCRDDDPEIEFYSDEWTDDLEKTELQKRYFENIRRKDGVIRIEIAR